MSTFFRLSLFFESKSFCSYIINWKLIQLILQILINFFRTKLEFVLSNNNNNKTTTTTILVVKCVT